MRSDPQRAAFYNRDRVIDYSRMAPAQPRGRLGRAAAYLGAAIKVRRAIRADPAALVIVENVRLGIILGLLSRLTGTSTPLVIWNFNISRPYRGLRLWLAQFALRTVVAAFVHSRHELAQYSQNFRLPPGRLRFKPLSGPYLEDERYSALKTASKQQYVVCPGYSGRDFHLLAAIARRTPELSYRVLAWPSAVKGVAFPDNVRVESGLTELAFCRRIAEARLCLVPLANYDTANGHIAIVQAMSLGTLLITNPTPGSQDYLDDGRDCFLLDPGDVEGAANRVRRLYTHPGEFGGVIEAAAARARRDFTIQGDILAVHQLLAEHASAQ